MLSALQENNHMTKVEMFHCAACKVYISTSVAEVQAHITSEEHLSRTKVMLLSYKCNNTDVFSLNILFVYCDCLTFPKEFEVHRRHACLNKAEAMMKELKPQFEHFLKVFCKRFPNYLECTQCAGRAA